MTDKKILTSTSEDFAEVYNIITCHRERVEHTINNESLLMIWEVGGYVSSKLKSSNWGDGVVRQLAEYIHTQDPTVRGWSYRTIYKMAQFYDAYSNAEFQKTLSAARMLEYHPTDIVPTQLAQLEIRGKVPMALAQIPEVLLSTGWSNHQMILGRCDSNEERLFYMLYARHEKLKHEELKRAIKTNVMTSLLSEKEGMSKSMKDKYPSAPILFKDKVFLDMLGLPLKYREMRLRKGIVSHMKEFILEMGKDFLFIDQEYPVVVGDTTFKIDLLFYHRLLQCMVAIELKTTEFKPKDLGQLAFYLEALDQEERRSNENPTIGILLCRDANMDVVKVAMNSTMSPTMVAKYEEQLKVGSVLQRSLVEFCKFINEGGKKGKKEDAE